MKNEAFVIGVKQKEGGPLPRLCLGTGATLLQHWGGSARSEKAGARTCTRKHCSEPDFHSGAGTAIGGHLPARSVGTPRCSWNGVWLGLLLWGRSVEHPRVACRLTAVHRE